MKLSDHATQDYIFQNKDGDLGVLTCRRCDTTIIIELKIFTLLIFSSTKVKIIGKWCKHSSIERIIRTLIYESIG
jgi:hypothetical protein